MEKSYIKKTREDVRKAIKLKSAESLPDNPTAQGYSANEIKKTLYAPITDDENSVLAEMNRIVEETNEALEEKQPLMPQNPSGSLSNIIVATPIYNKTDNEKLKIYIGKPLMEVTNGYGNGDGNEDDVVLIDGNTYYIKPYYPKRLAFNTAGENTASSSAYCGVITSVNFDAKREASEIPINPDTLPGGKKYDAVNFPNGRMYYKSEFSLADKGEPTSMTIPVRTSEGQIVANPGSLPYMVTVNKQLDAVREELDKKLDKEIIDALDGVDSYVDEEIEKCEARLDEEINKRISARHDTYKTQITGNSGWWRIAKKSCKDDFVNNIIRLFIGGGKDTSTGVEYRGSDIMFVASQAKGQCPTITVLNHQVVGGTWYDKTDKAIVQGIRIQYTPQSSTDYYTEAYIEVYLQGPPNNTEFIMSIMKRGVMSGEWPGDWTLVPPTQDYEDLSNGNVTNCSKSAVRTLEDRTVLYKHTVGSVTDATYYEFVSTSPGLSSKYFDGGYKLCLSGDAYCVLNGTMLEPYETNYAATGSVSCRSITIDETKYTYIYGINFGSGITPVLLSGHPPITTVIL